MIQKAAKKFPWHGPNASSVQPAETRDHANAHGYNWPWRKASTAWRRLPENLLCIDGKAVFAMKINQSEAEAGLPVTVSRG